MAKSCLPLAAMACALTLALGCGGEGSMASRSARALQQAQQRGEVVGGEGHAHATSEPAAHQHENTAVAGEPRATGDQQPTTHEAQGHGRAGSAAAKPAAGQAAHQHVIAPTSAAAGADGGAHTGAAVDHTAMGHAPADHDAMGHAAAAAAVTTGSSASPPQPVHAAAVPPVGAGTPAATLAPDAIDAPAPSAVVDARLGAAASAGGHAAHGAATYRQLDAGRTSSPQHAPGHDQPDGQGPGRAGLEEDGRHGEPGENGGQGAKGAHDPHDHTGGHAPDATGNVP